MWSERAGFRILLLPRINAESDASAGTVGDSQKTGCNDVLMFSEDNKHCMETSDASPLPYMEDKLRRFLGHAGNMCGVQARGFDYSIFRRNTVLPPPSRVAPRTVPRGDLKVTIQCKGDNWS